MKKTTTRRDIGARLGVSTVTISKALSGKDGVSDSVREKIIETAREMGYHYAPSTQENKEGALIGILIADRFFSAPSFYFDIYKALLRELTDAGMLGVLDIISEQDEKNLTMPTAMTIQRATGFVLLGQFDEDYVASMLDSGLPTVLMDFSFDGPDVDAVVSDGESGCYQLTRYLIERGHTKIGFVGSIYRTTSIMDRYNGYRRAMMLAGLPVDESWIIPDSEDNISYIPELAFPDPMPTALVCNNDMLACRVARDLEKRGYRIPEDVSVTGFDNYVYGPKTRPITTYAVDRQRMAQVTVRRLQTRIREGIEGPLRTVVGGWLVERDSVWDLRTGRRCGNPENGK